MTFDPASRIQDFLVFGEFGDVNPSITDSSTYTFLSPERWRSCSSTRSRAASSTRVTGTRPTSTSPTRWRAWRTASRRR